MRDSERWVFAKGLNHLCLQPCPLAWSENGRPGWRLHHLVHASSWFQHAQVVLPPLMDHHITKLSCGEMLFLLPVEIGVTQDGKD